MSTKVILIALVLAVVVPFSESLTTTPAQKHQDLSALVTAHKNFTVAQSVADSTSGRSAEPVTTNGASKPSAGSRGGRMLDLDHLAGDIDKNESLIRGQSVSGTRQSRILNEDLSFDASQLADGSNQKLAARSKFKNNKNKKLAIQGFIPIVSLDGGKIGADSEDNDDDDEASNVAGSSTSFDNNHQRYQLQGGHEQLTNSYGGKTSFGHASFGVQPVDDEAASRARRLSQTALISSLANHSPSKLVSNLFNPSSYQQHLSRPIQAPSNMPPMAQQSADLTECICVPFFQCKSGYLSEAQLSKAQIQQLFFQERNQNNHQTPRTGAEQQQQHYHQTDAKTAAMEALATQFTAAAKNQQQQQLNEAIYEQLRKTIEAGQLDQFSQQQLLQLQQQAELNAQQLDERSKAGAIGEISSGTVNATQSPIAEGTEERSFLKSTGRRSANHCGVLRTCCKLPPHLFAPPQIMQPMQHQLLNPNRAPTMQGESSQLQAQSLYTRPALTPSHQPPIVYPSLQESVQQIQPQFQTLSPHRHQPKLVDDYAQPSLPQIQHLRPQHSPNYNQIVNNQLSNQLQQNPNRGDAGFFMEGRCGSRQATGISGRVQNHEQPDNSAEFGEFPSQVAILKRLGSSESLFVCSAVLISSQWIATAAHCVRKYSVGELKVRLGEWDVQRDDEFYPFVENNLRDIVVHPEFQLSNLINDIALLRMDTPINGGGLGTISVSQQLPHISPACLPRAHESFDGQRCWVAGWGKDAFGQRGAFQSVLKKVDLPVLSRNQCEQALKSTRLGPYFRLHQSAMCAGGEQGKDACEGDGGSGLYCVDNGVIKVAGLVSWGLSCGQAGVPGVYTSMKTFVPWIESVVTNSGEENVYSGSLMDLSGLISERSKTAGSLVNATLVETIPNSNSTTSITSVNINAPENLESRSADAKQRAA